MKQEASRESQLRAELRAVKRGAEDLVDAVESFVVMLDEIMQRPASFDRGAAVAGALNVLEIRMQCLQRFGLKMSFEEIQAARAARKAALRV